jgi:hypothetical protein
MQALTDALLALFLALGSAWFALDLLRKLRGKGSDHQPGPSIPDSAPHPAPTPAPNPFTPLAPAPAAPASPPDSSTIPAHHLAAIAAAVHHLFRGRARLLSAAPAMPAAQPSAHAAIDWAREGRRDIFTSHRVR